MRNRVLLVIAVVMAALVFAGAARAQNVGDAGKATRDGREYDVKITKVSTGGAKCFVTWPGYNKSWDEWRACSEIKLSQPAKVAAGPSAKFSAGDKVKVLWKGSWYDAIVLAMNAKKKTCRIHYDGFGNNWDEWVGNERIKNKQGNR